jgi:hypothetical protein
MSSYYLPNRDTPCTYKRNNETRSPNHYCRRKAINITFSEYATVALGIHPAWKVLATYYIVICDMSGGSVFFSTTSLKRYGFREKELLNIKCVLISSATLVCNISPSKKNSAKLYHKFTWSSCKVPVILAWFYGNLIFSTNFRKKNLKKKYEFAW